MLELVLGCYFLKSFLRHIGHYNSTYCCRCGYFFFLYIFISLPPLSLSLSLFPLVYSIWMADDCDFCVLSLLLVPTDCLSVWLALSKTHTILHWQTLHAHATSVFWKRTSNLCTLFLACSLSLACMFCCIGSFSPLVWLFFSHLCAFQIISVCCP